MEEMEKNVERNLEKPENWDYDQAEIKDPVKSPRVVVSVAFRHDDFQNVSKLAQRLGKKTSEFIREAALDKASGRSCSSIIHSSGNMGVIWSTEQLPTTTRLYTFEKERIIDAAPGISG